MTIFEHAITIALCILATLIVRFLPFLLWGRKAAPPAFIIYLGKALPAALFGLLIVYGLKDVQIVSGNHGIPELIAIAAVAALHIRFRRMILSIASGTILYMFLVQVVFR